MNRSTFQNFCRVAALAAGISAFSALADSAPAASAEPNNAGLAKLVSASWIGGPGNDQIAGVAIDLAGDPILAMNATELNLKNLRPVVLSRANGVAPPDKKGGKQDKGALDPNAIGQLVTLSPDGQKVLNVSTIPGATLLQIKLGVKGHIYVLGNSPGGVRIGNASGQGRFVACLTPDGKQVNGAVFVDGASDFAVDDNGDVVMLAGAKLFRFSADGKEIWTATWSAHGGNRPGAIAMNPKTGVTAVVGYGMTNTGKEPWKDPYAHGIDRDGKVIWSLWNPDPKLEKGAQFGGNGLMADTTGHAAATDAAGRVYLMLYADGGNSVCSRDPSDPGKPLDKSVFAEAHQKGAGYGFKGASQTSVIFRINSETGALERGTWISSWLTPARANAFRIEAADGDGKDLQIVAGNSGAGCPTKDSWYVAPEGGYRGGATLAIFDGDFASKQFGYIPGAGFSCVAYRNGLIVAAGSAKAENEASDPAKPDAEKIKYPVPTYNAVQPTFGGGEKDGYVAIFRIPAK